MFVRGTCRTEAARLSASIREVYVCEKNGLEVYVCVYFAGQGIRDLL